MNVLGLVQLCEASQPAGGYGYTLGMERMIRGGRLRSAAELEELVTGVLEGAIGPADGVASGVTFRAARVGEYERIPEVCAVMSTRVPEEMRWASLQMGERLWAMSRGWGWAEGLHGAVDEIAVRNDLHHAVAFGLLVSETTNSSVRAVATYLYNTAKNIVTAGVALIPLPESEGMRVMSGVQGRIAELAVQYADRDVGDIWAR